MPGSRKSEEHLAQVGTYAEEGAAHEHGLVVLAMGLPYWLFFREGRYDLMVQTERRWVVVSELRKFDGEHQYWPPLEELPEGIEAGGISIALYALLLSVFYLAQRGALDLQVSIGGLSAKSVVEHGEWWRAVTALTIHGDIAHLCGNLIGGGWFSYYLLVQLGCGLGWLVIFSAGLAGNLATAWTYYPIDHVSIGASTAVFGALGGLVGSALASRSWRRVRGRPFDFMRPFAGGLALLALLGSGGEKTDVVAHLWGFGFGLLLVQPAHWLVRRGVSMKQWGWALGVSVVVALGLAWLAAGQSVRLRF